MMTDFTIVSTFEGWNKVSPASQPLAWLLASMFPDNCVLFADFMVGLALYKVTMSEPKSAS